MRGPNRFRTERARTLRRSDNEAETKLWSELRNRRLNGFKFVRQVPIGPYFADFACRNGGLAVELDGSQHLDNGYDRTRDRYFADSGWSVLRFWNVDALRAVHDVLETILAALEGRLEPTLQTSDLRFIASPGYRHSAPHPLPDLLPDKDGEKEEAPALTPPSPRSLRGEGKGEGPVP